MEWRNKLKKALLMKILLLDRLFISLNTYFIAEYSEEMKEAID